MSYRYDKAVSAWVRPELRSDPSGGLSLLAPDMEFVVIEPLRDRCIPDRLKG